MGPEVISPAGAEAASSAAAGSSSADSKASALSAFLGVDDAPTEAVSLAKEEEAPLVGEEAQAGVVAEEEAPERVGEEGEPTGFQLPDWAADLPADAQANLSKLGGNLLDQVAKLKRQRSSADEEREAAKAELETLRAETQAMREAVKPIVDHVDSLGSITSLDRLETHVAEAQSAVDWVEEQLERMRDEGLEEVEYGNESYNREALKRIRRNAQAAIAAAPGRRDYLQAYGMEKDKAKTLYPKLFQEGTAERKAADALVSKAPGMVRLPNHATVIGDHLTMEQVRSGKFKLVPVGNAAPEPRPKPKAEAPALGAGAASAPVKLQTTASNTLDVATLRERASKGDKNAKAKLVTAFLG